MTMKEKATFNTRALIGLLSIAAIGVSIYLTQHFFQVHFPQGLSGGSLCDLGSFLNCDGATLSPLSNIFGSPISLLGIIMGALFFSGLIFSNDGLDSTIILFGKINFVGCIVLFLYSLIALGSLCPFCTVYYILSGVLLWLYIKNSEARAFHLPSSAVVAVLFGVVTLSGHLTYKDKEKGLLQLKDSLISQFKGLTPVDYSKPYPATDLHTATSDFSKAPVQLVIFSDFQCPACKMLSELVPKLVKRYKDKINIKYLFYPLDPLCNSKMTSMLHPLACKAAALAYCQEGKLMEAHDEIFENQSDLSEEWLSEKVKEANVAECYENEKTMSDITKIVDIGNEIGIKSTPTILLNNIKIEGVLPLNQYIILMDYLISKNE